MPLTLIQMLIFSLLFLFFPNFTLSEDLNSATSEIVHHYKSDCSEPLNKDASCLVKIVDCFESIYPFVEDGQEPASAHDIRVAPIVKAFGGNNINSSKHSLFVDVSWQMPVEESNSLQAFKLQVSSGFDSKCFVFNVTERNDTSGNHASSRYRFSSSTLFNYGRNYSIDIYSLPRSNNIVPHIGTVVAMPDDPDNIGKKYELCQYQSNPQATRWAASYRKIYLYNTVRIIHIEFLAAPPSLCIEEYEMRLLDSSGIMVLDSVIIPNSALKTEVINGKTIQFGEYNFTNILLDTEYIPSVLPVERSAKNGRCLCPTISGCSCLAADWKPIKLTKKFKDIPVNETMARLNEVTTTAPKDHPSNPYLIISISCGIGLIILIISCCCAAALLKKYRRQIKKEEEFDFIGKKQVYGQCGTQPLIVQEALSVLILYSHDCSQHEAAVLAFAELLRDAYGLNVHIDVWDEREIEENRIEYLNSCIVRADKIIIVNSLGSQSIVGARRRREPHMERIVPGMLDNIFVNQIDLALQHVCVISVRFPYTPKSCTLFSLTPLLQYSIPENINQFISRLMDTPRPPNRLSGFNPQFSKLQAAFSRMNNFVEEEPNWYEETHHRVPCLPIQQVIDRREEVVVEIMHEPVTVVEKEKEEEEVHDEPEPEIEIEPAFKLVSEPEEVEEYLEIGSNDNNDSCTLDSAYVSGSDFSTQIDNDAILFEKTRISEYIPLRKKQSDSAYHDDEEEFIDVH